MDEPVESYTVKVHKKEGSMMQLPHVSVPVPDQLEVNSDGDETILVLTYTNPISEREALDAARELLTAHEESK